VSPVSRPVIGMHKAYFCMRVNIFDVVMCANRPLFDHYIVK